MVTGNNLVFPTHISGNDNGNFHPQEGIFVAPKKGRYAFSMYFLIQNGDTNYLYYIQLHHNESVRQHLRASGSRHGYSYDNRQYNTEIDLKKGDAIYFRIISHTD